MTSNSTIQLNSVVQTSKSKIPKNRIPKLFLLTKTRFDPIQPVQPSSLRSASSLTIIFPGYPYLKLSSRRKEQQQQKKEADNNISKVQERVTVSCSPIKGKEDQKKQFRKGLNSFFRFNDFLANFFFSIIPQCPPLCSLSKKQFSIIIMLGRQEI